MLLFSFDYTLVLLSFADPLQNGTAEDRKSLVLLSERVFQCQIPIHSLSRNKLPIEQAAAV